MTVPNILADLSIGRHALSLFDQNFSYLGGGPRVADAALNTLSTNLGPSGLGWIAFDGTAAYSYTRGAVPGAHGGVIHTVNASITDTPGSGTFGPASADVAHLFSGQKTNYLTSTTDGEIDTVISLVRQGRAGDAGAFIGDAAKVKSGTGADSGGVAGMELAAAWQNTSGVEQNAVHTLAPFMESAAGVSGGIGYGLYTDSWKGTNYAGVYVGCNLANDATTGWQWAYLAANSRTIGGQYFRIRGDKVSGAAQPGDIVQGYTGFTKILRTEGSTFKIRNTADDTDLLTVTDGGRLAVGTAASDSNPGYSVEAFPTTNGTFGAPAFNFNDQATTGFDQPNTSTHIAMAVSGNTPATGFGSYTGLYAQQYGTGRTASGYITGAQLMGTLVSGSGIITGSNSVSVLPAGAASDAQSCGAEINTVANNSSPIYGIQGLRIVNQGSGAATTFSDYLYMTSSGAALQFGVHFGDQAGTLTYPVKAGGSLIYSDATAVALAAGLDFSNTHSFTSGAVCLYPDGGTGSAIQWGGSAQGGRIKSNTAANGGELIFDTNFTALQFNGTTNALIAQSDGKVLIANDLYSAGVKVVGARDTGWTAMTGTPNKAATYDVASVTLAQLAARVAQLQAVLTAHGLIGA